MTHNSRPDKAGTPPIEIAIGLALDGSTPPRVLIARRRTTALRGGLWEFPGGKIEPGETAEAAVRREYLEEVGCDIEVLSELPPSADHDPSLERESHVRLRPFTGRLVGRSSPMAHASDEVRWVPVGELRSLPWPAANLAVIDSLERWLQLSGPPV
ncbi:MAG: (deoxy)nucleoside triphosphate pyrophosphohydrolase [Phycisphaerales bacterium]